MSVSSINTTPTNYTATYLATNKGDTERNVYATQLPQVMDDASLKYNMAAAEAVLKKPLGTNIEALGKTLQEAVNGLKTFDSTKKLDKNTLSTTHTHSPDHGGCAKAHTVTTGRYSQEYQTAITALTDAINAFNTEAPEHLKIQLAQGDKQGLDYDVFYMKGMEDLIQQVEKAGLKFPKSVNTLSYAQNEQLKSVRSGMNSLNDADPDPLLGGLKGKNEINRRMANEKQMAIYSNKYHHIGEVLSTQSEHLARLLQYNATTRMVEPNQAFSEAITGGKKSILAFLKEKNLPLDSSNVGPSQKLKVAIKDYETAKNIFETSRQDIETTAEALENATSKVLESIFKRTPLTEKTIELAKLRVSEQAQQEKAEAPHEKQEHQIKRISINGSSAYLESREDGGFRLHQPYGQHNGDPCGYELIGKNEKGKTTYTLNRIEPNKPPIAIRETDISLGTLKEYFHAMDIDDLFGSASFQLPKEPSFSQLKAKLKTQETINKQIQQFQNQPLKDKIATHILKENIVSVQGTGFSYNAGIYGENQAVDSRNVMTGILFDLALEGKVALHGSCGFQQNAIWNMGGNIIALQDTTGKTFLPDPNHGNDPFTVEEKASYQATKRYTARYGLHEQPVAKKTDQSNIWETRQHVALSVPLKNKNKSESRNILVKFNGEPVIGLAGYKAKNLSEDKTDGFPSTVSLVKKWKDSEQPLDQEGKPIGQPSERSRIELKYDKQSKSYQITEITHWKAVPLADPNDRYKLKEIEDPVTKQKTFAIGYEEIKQTAKDLEPSILVDDSFDAINCVHTQNGLGLPHENENLGGRLQIEGTSVLGNDDRHGRSSILATSKRNQIAHPVYVDPRAPQQEVISESVTLYRGNLAVGTFNQHHSDMMKEEGQIGTNPYQIGHVDYIEDEYKGNRNGNDSVIATGVLLKNQSAFIDEFKEKFQPAESQEEFGKIKENLTHVAEDPEDPNKKIPHPKQKTKAEIQNILEDKAAEAKAAKAAKAAEATVEATATVAATATVEAPATDEALATVEAPRSIKPSRSLKELFESEQLTEATVADIASIELKGDVTDKIIENLKTELKSKNQTISKETEDGLRGVLNTPDFKDFKDQVQKTEGVFAQLASCALQLEELRKVRSTPTTKTMTAQEEASDQRRFRGPGIGRDGWAQGVGLTAGVGGTGITHALYSALEPLGATAALVGQIATVVDSVLPFGFLLAAAGIESFKNAAYATRRLNHLKTAYEAEHKAYQELTTELKVQIGTIRNELDNNLLDNALQSLKKTEETLNNRLNLIQQDLNEKLVDMASGPLLPAAAAATLVGGSAMLAGATALSGVAGLVGGAALTAYGALQTGKAVRSLFRSNKITRELVNKDLGVDSGIRRNFHIYHQQRRNALKFKIANWSTFTAGSAMLLSGSAATVAGVTAPVGIALGAVGGLMVAGSVVTGVIDPKREWRGKTTVSAEDTLHLQGDFLSSARRRNRLVNNLNGQMGIWVRTVGNIVDRALTSNEKGMKNFSRRFNIQKTLRWFIPGYHMRTLARAMTNHPNEVKDHQYHLMVRVTMNELNFINFKVDEMKQTLETTKAGLETYKKTKNNQNGNGITRLFETQITTISQQLENTKAQQAQLSKLLQDLQTYEPEIGRQFRQNTNDNTKTKFDSLRLKFMLAHDLITDGLHRRDIWKLVQYQAKSQINPVLEAVIGKTTYTGTEKMDKLPAGKVRAVKFKANDESVKFIQEALTGRKIGKDLTVDRLFARVMCFSLPSRINYELTGTMNIHMEDLRQKAKEQPIKKERTTQQTPETTRTMETAAASA